MRDRHRSYAAAAVVLTLSLVGFVPLGAQEVARGWTFIAAAGYASHLDDGGSFSVGASALRGRSPKLSLGIEGGYDRHEVFGGSGESWRNPETNGTGECPSPCTYQRIRFSDKYVAAAWHVGGVLRYIFSPSKAAVPSAELGMGLYGLRTYNERLVQDAATGALVPQLSGGGSSTEVAPGMSGALGVDVFPRNGRIGVGVVGRLRGAALPMGDALLAVGFASLQVRVTVR